MDIFMAASSPPAYPHRCDWVPKNIEDFGGGGAYPEIHVAQFPAGQLSQYKRGAAEDFFRLSSKLVTTQDTEEIANVKPDDEKTRELAESTQAALNAIREGRLGKDQLSKVEKSLKAKDKYFKYIPDLEAPGYNPEITERIIRVVEKPVDPLEPPKFRNKLRLAVQDRSEKPVPILRPPPNKLTAAQKEEWAMPPCISNWINPSGHTLPLAMRIQANRADSENVGINPKLAAFSEALYMAEKAAREELKIKQDLRKQKLLADEKEREEKLRDLATQARAEKSALLLQRTYKEERYSQDDVKDEDDSALHNTTDMTLRKIDAERKRELIREARINRARDDKKRPRVERDVSERIALGAAAPTR